MPASYLVNKPLSARKKRRRQAKYQAQQFDRSRGITKPRLMPWEKKKKIRILGRWLNRDAMPLLQMTEDTLCLDRESYPQLFTDNSPLWKSIGYAMDVFHKLPTWIRNAGWFQKRFSHLWRHWKTA